MPSDPDPVAAGIVEARAVLARFKDCGYDTLDDSRGWNEGDVTGLAGWTECLLAAVEAVLPRHLSMIAVRLVPCPEHERWRGPLVGDNDNLAVRRACPNCQVFDESYCRNCSDDEGRFQDWPCSEYRAVSAALLGKEEADGN